MPFTIVDGTKWSTGFLRSSSVNTVTNHRLVGRRLFRNDAQSQNEHTPMKQSRTIKVAEFLVRRSS